MTESRLWIIFDGKLISFNLSRAAACADPVGRIASPARALKIHASPFDLIESFEA